MKLSEGKVVLERPHAAVRVLLFHHAGGSAMSLLPLARSLPEDCEPVLFELGGRGTRVTEGFAQDFDEAVGFLKPSVAQLIDRPVVFLGHSLGALIAHSLACGLDEPQRDLLRAVVVSSIHSPRDAAAEATRPARPFVVRTRDDIRGELEERGGCPPEVFEDDELVEHAITLLGHDLHLYDTYQAPPRSLGDVPLHVWYGRDDRFLDGDAMARWSGDDVRTFRGGHFYLLQQKEPQRALDELLQEVIGSSPVRRGNGVMAGLAGRIRPF